MTASAKPMPTLRGEERRWFEAAFAGHIAYQHCQECQATINYPRVACPHCFSDNLVERASRGRGVIHSFTTQHRAGGAAFADDVPYTIVLVDLDEGIRVLANLVGANEGEIVIGAPVEAFFDRVTDELAVPRFRLAEPTGGSDAG